MGNQDNPISDIHEISLTFNDILNINFRSSLLTSPESLLMSSVVRAISCEERERESHKAKGPKDSWRRLTGKHIMRVQSITRRPLDESPSCSDGGMLCLSPWLRSVFQSRPDRHFLLSQHKIGVNFT